MKVQLVVAMVALSFMAGLAVAGISGYGPLAYISYNIVVQHMQAQVIPAYINLGNLTAGEVGKQSAEAALTIPRNGTYVLKLVDPGDLGEVFSTFTVELGVGGKTIVLTLSNSTAYVTLTQGTYNVTITVMFQVSQSPEGDLHVVNRPLVVIFPASENEEQS